MLKKEQKKDKLALFRTTFSILKKTMSAISSAISIIITVFLVFAFIGFFSLFLPPFEQKTGNIEIIPIEGIIASSSDNSLLGEKIAQADKLIKELKEANKNPQIKAIILEINSPGGAPVASYELASAIKKINKTTIAVIREVGASGAFWAATAANKIYANQMSLTGSIGVLASHLEFAGIMQKYNVTYRRLVAGKYKDAGTPYKQMTTDEQAIYQKILDKLHEQFINAVAQNRKMSFEQVRAVADGFIILGSEAKEKGLIDEIGGIDEAVTYLEQKLNITAQTFEYKEKAGIKELLAGVLDKQSFWFGQGFAKALFLQTKPNIAV